MDDWVIVETNWPAFIGVLVFVLSLIASLITCLYFKGLPQRRRTDSFSRLEDEAQISVQIERQRGYRSDNNTEVRLENERLKAELRKMTEERNDYCSRLSEKVSVQMRTNNPNIVDLNDQFRPTKLADVSSELYDNEWTDAFDVLKENGLSENECIRILLDIVMESYQVCRREIELLREITEKLHFGNLIGPGVDKNRLSLLEVRKSMVLRFQPDISEKILKAFLELDVRPVYDSLSTVGPVRVYLDACIRLCLRMVVQEPSVVWHCPGWTSKYAMDISVTCLEIISETTQLLQQNYEPGSSRLIIQHMKENTKTDTNTKNERDEREGSPVQSSQLIQTNNLHSLEAANQQTVDCKPGEIEETRNDSKEPSTRDTCFDNSSDRDHTIQNDAGASLEDGTESLTAKQGADELANGNKEQHAIDSNGNESMDNSDAIPKTGAYKEHDITTADVSETVNIQFGQQTADGNIQDPSDHSIENQNENTENDKCVNYVATKLDGDLEPEVKSSPEQVSDATEASGKSDADVRNVTTQSDSGGQLEDKSSTFKDSVENATNNLDFNSSTIPLVIQENNGDRWIDFEKEVFSTYTKRGDLFEFIVWPAMFLQNNMLRKGVAQGMVKSTEL